MTGEQAQLAPDAEADPAPAPACLNCATPLAGPFCHQCGQEGRSSLYSLRQLLAEVMHEVLDLEGRVVRSLWSLLSRPGRMTLEYIEGKRVRYVSPLRVYLLASVVSVTVGAALGDDGLAPVPSRPEATAAGSLAVPPEGEIAPGVKVSVGGDAKSKAVFKRVGAWLPTAFMVLPPALALVLMAIYRRRRLPYSAHLFLALHLQAFTLLVFAAGKLLGWPLYWMFGPRPSLGTHVADAMIAIGVVVHIVFATRRVYGLRWRTAIVRVPVLMFSYGMVTLAVVMVTVRLAQWFVR